MCRTIVSGARCVFCRAEQSQIPAHRTAQKANHTTPSWWAAAKNKLTPTKELTPAQRVIEETRAREKEEAKARERKQKVREKEEMKAAKKGKDGEWPASTSNRDNDPALSALKSGTEAALLHLKAGGNMIRAPAPSTPSSRKPVPLMGGSPVSPSPSPAPARPIAATTPPNLSPRRTFGTLGSQGPVADTSASNPFNAPPANPRQVSTTSTNNVTTHDLTRQFPSTPKMTTHEIRAASPILEARGASPGPYARANGVASYGDFSPPADYTPNRHPESLPKPLPEQLAHTVFTPSGALDVSEIVLAVARRLEKLEKCVFDHSIRLYVANLDCQMDRQPRTRTREAHGHCRGVPRRATLRECIRRPSLRCRQAQYHSRTRQHDARPHYRFDAP